MASNSNNLVKLDDSDDDVKFIGHGTKRKIIEVDLLEDIIIGVTNDDPVVYNNIPEQSKTKSVKKLKKNEDLGNSIDDVSPCHWTTDMKEYYNKVSKKCLNFSLERTLNAMSTEKRLWLVNAPTPRSNETICFNCGKYGHRDNFCREHKCYMCGSKGHKVKSCPNTKCLTCGLQTPRGYVVACDKCYRNRGQFCKRCHKTGHSLINCTDHWRRFHNVTTLQRVEPPFSQVNKHPDNLWCCNCGRRGHVHEQCWPMSGPQHFPPTSTFVVSYDRAFDCDKADIHDVARLDYEISTSMKPVEPIPDPMRHPVHNTPNRYFIPAVKSREMKRAVTHFEGNLVEEPKVKKSNAKSKNKRKKLKRMMRLQEHRKRVGAQQEKVEERQRMDNSNNNQKRQNGWPRNQNRDEREPMASSDNNKRGWNGRPRSQNREGLKKKRFYSSGKLQYHFEKF